MRACSPCLRTWTALAVFALLPAYGQAQTAAPTAPSSPAAVTPSRSGFPAVPPQQARAQAAKDRQEQRIAALHRQLKITPAQQPQWDAFVTVMRDNLAHMHAVYEQNADRGASTALDDMRAYAAITGAHAQDVQNLVPAFETLYAAMTPEQKKTADAVFQQYARQQARVTPARE